VAVGPPRPPVDLPDHCVIESATRLLRVMLLKLPTWASVAVISGTSVGLTVGLVLAIHVFGAGYGTGLWRPLLIGTVLPFVVSAPVGYAVVGLLRALEREHAKALALSQVDALTGLLNRRTVQIIAHRDIDIARRSGQPLTVALLDLDDFKTTNDLHGHAVGDALLRAVAEACTVATRVTDVVSRWGGEEIVMVLPGTDAFAAVELLDKVRAAVTTAGVQTCDGEWLHCTASIGAACLAPRDADARAEAVFQRLVDAADRAMYEAKRAGKNRVRVGDPAEETVLRPA
jgi:diguanylate cyclase (GGDEF)-like protein